MKSIRYVGVLTVALAALAMSAGASTAFGYSEYKTTGQFPVSVKGDGGRVTIEAQSGNSFSCEKSNLNGSITSPNQLTATLEFRGKCEMSGSIRYGCPTLTTKQLTGKPGENLGGSVVGKTTKDGVLFEATTEPIAEFTCESTKYKFTGGFICESMPIGKMTRNGEYACKQTSAGKQEFTSIEIDGKVFKAELKAEGTLGFFKLNESLALSMKESLTFTNQAGEVAYVEQTP